MLGLPLLLGAIVPGVLGNLGPAGRGPASFAMNLLGMFRTASNATNIAASLVSVAGMGALGTLGTVNTAMQMGNLANMTLLNSTMALGVGLGY